MGYFLNLISQIAVPCALLVLPAKIVFPTQPKGIRSSRIGSASRRKESVAVSPIAQSLKSPKLDAKDRENSLLKDVKFVIDQQPFISNLVRELVKIPSEFESFINTILQKNPDDVQHSDSENNVARYFNELERTKLLANSIIQTPGWTEVTQRNGVTVFRKWLPKDAYGSAYPCIKATATVDVSASEFVDLLMDSNRVLEYNKYSTGRQDIAFLGPCTKIVWNKTNPPLTKKRFDFCTLMHVDQNPDGSYIVTTHATDHFRAPVLDGYTRSEIVLGVTVVTPSEDAPNDRSFITTVNHIVSPGIPTLIANSVSAKNAIDFIVDISKVASHSKARASSN